MASLLDKRLLIFSGKGGVGKSTVSAAVAVAAARTGRRVLIIEIGDQERIPAIFGAKKAGYDGAKVWANGKKDDAQGGPGGAPPGARTRGQVWSVCLTARESLHEFVIRQVKLEAIYKTVFENRVIRFFTAAAPGLDELVMMGKIENLVTLGLPKKGPKKSNLDFDLVVFDAPATGHGLAFFKVPQMTMRMVRMGPLHRKAETMWNLLTDPERTAFNIVTLPEEMPVNESIDLHKAADEVGLPPGKLLVNGVYPDIFEGNGKEIARLEAQADPAEGISGKIAKAALDNARTTYARYEMHREMIDKLEEAVPRERVELPFVFTPGLGPAEIETLADYVTGL